MQAFDKKHKTFSFEKATTKTTIEARKLFQIFGSLISDLDLEFRSCPKATDIMDAVVRYCTTLDCLKLRGYDIPDNQEKISNLGKLFQSLRTLHIELVAIEGSGGDVLWNDKILTTPNGNVMDFFAECPSLINLKVEHCDSLNRIIFESALHNLQSFEYFGYGIQCSIDGFTLRHKYLKSFILIEYECEDEHGHLPALKVIAANCKNLEKLQFDFGTSSSNEYVALLMKLSRLRRFRALKFDCYKHTMVFTTILPSFRDTLEVLDISEATASHGLILAISELRKLRSLRLCNCSVRDDLSPLGELTELSVLSIEQIEEILNFDLVRLVDRLINLRIIQLYFVFKIGFPTYVQLVDTVERRQDVAKRTLQIDCPTSNNFADSQVVKFAGIEPHQVGISVNFLTMFCLKKNV